MSTKWVILPARGLPAAWTLITNFVLSLFWVLDMLYILIMYICIYIYIYIYRDVYICINMYIYIYICILDPRLYPRLDPWLDPGNNLTTNQKIVFSTSGNIRPVKLNHFSIFYLRVGYLYQDSVVLNFEFVKKMLARYISICSFERASYQLWQIWNSRLPHFWLFLFNFCRVSEKPLSFTLPERVFSVFCTF